MRKLVPEILDSLPPSDPEAVRSREDLRRLDVVLGGSRWIVKQLSKHARAMPQGIVEIGAGEGRLCRRLAEAFPGTPVVGMDLLPPPAGCPSAVCWEQGNFLDRLAGVPGDVLVGSLILHHLPDDELTSLAVLIRRFRGIVFSEPWRSRVALGLARLADPFVGRVTRHDMSASIRAGFRRGELPALLQLDKTRWRIWESLSLAGTIRFQAWQDFSSR